MTTQKRDQMMSLNRLLILALTATGLSMDGLEYSDPIFLAASFLWLWMPECVRIEVEWLQNTHWKKRGLDDDPAPEAGIYVARQSA